MYQTKVLCLAENNAEEKLNSPEYNEYAVVGCVRGNSNGLLIYTLQKKVYPMKQRPS